MKKNKLPDELEACCELCEYSCKIDVTGEMLCKYKNRLKIVDENDVCKKFSFNIFSYKPAAKRMPKVFDFTKV